MAASSGEMPFLDHLEELRSRILKVLAAVIAGFGVGFWIVQRFQFVTLLKAPIAPYLPDGRLTVLSPTEPVMIVLKLVLPHRARCSPPRSCSTSSGGSSRRRCTRRSGAPSCPRCWSGPCSSSSAPSLGYVFVVPQALRVLFSFQTEALQPMITYDAYFGFVMQILIGLGLSFEIPLVITILAGFGLVTPAALNRFRRFEVVLAFGAGALLLPGGGRALDVHDDHPDPHALRGRGGRGGPDASPPAQARGRRGRRVIACVASGARRPRRRCPHGPRSRRR